MPPSKDALAAIVRAASRTNIPKEAGKLLPETPEKLQEPPVVAGLEITVSDEDIPLVEDVLKDTVLDFEEDAEAALPVGFDKVASATRLRSQPLSKIAGAIVTAKAKLKR